LDSIHVFLKDYRKKEISTSQAVLEPNLGEKNLQFRFFQEKNSEKHLAKILLTQLFNKLVMQLDYVGGVLTWRI